MLPGVPIALRRAAALAPVHPASRAALHRWRLARRSLACHGQAAGCLCQLFRLRGVVRLILHFAYPRHDCGPDRQSRLARPD